MKVRVLDQNTINMIAAGEVIENPSNVVKELVENSIDSGAKHIVVEVSSDITSYIKVVDDGFGFDDDDIETAFLKHATSKLTKLSDLYDIDSYGFRGEALPSISSVARVSLITKKKDKNGYKYTVDFGEGSVIEETAANDGTTIIVRDLFGNTQVRRKFLKSDQKEIANVYDIVEKMAYVRCDISFTFMVDGKVRFKTIGDGSLKNVIYEVYGKDIYDALIKVESDIKGIKISGYIAKPIVARNTKSDMVYFVNDRYVKNKIISKAIEDSYSTYLMQHKYPLCVLDIEVDKKKIDVNVHPKKEEVRFEEDDIVYYAVYNALFCVLNSENLIHEEKLTYEDNQYEDKHYEDKQIKNRDIDSLESLDSNNLSDLFTNIKEITPDIEEKPFIQKTLSDDHRYIGQVFATYILVEYEEKLYIIDQHAAHEKINFERLMNSYKSGEELSQKIFPSIVIKLTPHQYEIVDKYIDDFKKIGFEIELFGDNDIKVDAVPYNLLGIGNKELLLDIIDNFSDLSSKEKYDSIVEKIASISCKKAIKANRILSENEVKSLLRELFTLENPYNCPHGRPTIISLSKSEFEKRFGRIV